MQKGFVKSVSVLGTALFFGFCFFAIATASETNGTIDSTNKYAWSNNGGWVNFGATNGSVVITDSGISGYAWNENYGWINMSPANSGVSVSASGALSGSAWGQNTGWIDFTGTNINCSGQFTGQITNANDNIGTITFDCTNCDVSTDYRPQDCRETTPGGINLYSVCDTTTHKCVLTVGVGANECQTLSDWCCDPRGDLDFDTNIGLKDFSIMMYYWSDSPPSYKCPDINTNGTVELKDFSIMMYWWTD
ncbi:MAG: hypothetical protein Q8Q48_01275 [Candidatus Staskawiczbacteria bacterium]|nr:hypothetical protein [Candidatus Staskawiczbacteria bacterium]